MKTFEESYTAWIDGQLQGPALSAFEQELARREAEDEAVADREDTHRLRGLLQDHYQAPALTNPDFFSHQLRERIEAERKASSRGRENVRAAAPAFFAWGIARLIGVGAVSVFAAAAIYYGMVPSHLGTAANYAAAHGNAAANRSTAGNEARLAATTAPTPAPAAVAPGDEREASGPVQMVQLAPTPVPFDLSAEPKPHAADPSANPAAVTPLHYNQPNVNVLWLNGLEYLPSVSEATDPGAGTDTPAPAPAPSASTTP